MPEIKLSKLQIDILNFLGNSSFGKNFYWTGGTLLSHEYLNHRDSVDLDFFSDDLFVDEEYLIFANDLKKAVGIDNIEMTLKNNRRMFLIGKKNETTKLELTFFPFPFMEKRKKLSEFPLFADSLTDIMVNKILSTYQRDEVKDAYDLYCYLNDKPKYNLEQLINFVGKKFGVEIESALLLAKINSLIKNLNLIQALLFDVPKNLEEDIRTFFQNEFNKIAKKTLK